MVLIWLTKARASLKEIAEYYKKEYSEQSAKKIVSQIRTAVDKLKNFPELAAIEPLLEDMPKTFRSLVVARNYKVIYYIDSETIYISRIWDCRQAPETNVKKIKE